MLRRGIPFGPTYDHRNPSAPENRIERGLLFVSYQSQIGRQFEVLNTDWMNSFNGPQSVGFDLLVDQSVPTESGHHASKAAEFHHSASNGVGIPFDAPRQWIVPTGAAYLFTPSLSFIASTGRLPSLDRAARRLRSLTRR
jgi:hypothetical protein